MITAKQAYEATNPDDTPEQREQSALALMAGVAANDAYQNSRPELEQIIAAAQPGGPSLGVPPEHGGSDPAQQVPVQTVSDVAKAIGDSQGAASLGTISEGIHDAEVIAETVTGDDRQQLLERGRKLVADLEKDLAREI